MADREALVLTTAAAASDAVNGAVLRVDDVTRVLDRAGFRVTRRPVGRPLDGRRYDVGVAVSYACAGGVADLRERCDRVWLDAVDSWLLVNGSGLRRGHGTYALRAVRDAARLRRMPAPDLVTWISAADRASDRRTVRGDRRLVLPGSTTRGAAVLPQAGPRRVVLAGDWDYAPNRDALQRFERAVLPALEARRHADDWVVTVFGDAAGLVSSSRVQVLGYAPDPTALYRAGDVHAAPVRFGAGVKRKVLQPLLHGLPVVTTRAGAHGLRPHTLLDVRDDPADQAAALARRLDDTRPPRAVHPAELLDADDTAAVEAWLRS